MQRHFSRARAERSYLFDGAASPVVVEKDLARIRCRLGRVNHARAVNADRSAISHLQRGNIRGEKRDWTQTDARLLEQIAIATGCGSTVANVSDARAVPANLCITEADDAGRIS